MAGAFVVPAQSALGSHHADCDVQRSLSIRVFVGQAQGSDCLRNGVWTHKYEMNLLYIAGLLTLALGGPGRLSVDHCLRISKQDSKS